MQNLPPASKPQVKAQYLVGFLVGVTEASPHLTNGLGNVTH